MTFDLAVTLPPAWDAVSQGERTLHVQGGSAAVVAWRSPEPQNEIYHHCREILPNTPVLQDHAQAMVFLRTPDETLANKYLDATAALS